MNEEDRRTIYNTQNQKTTEELLEIWRTNDRVEWMDEAFEAIEQILKERLGELPPQDEPVLVHDEDDQDESVVEKVLYDGYDPENAPAFYDPWEVLRLEKWINLAAIAGVIASVFTNLLGLNSVRTSILSFLSFSSNSVLISWLLSIFVLIFAIGLQSILVYFPLKALGWVLKILMEMEFRSRGVNLQEKLDSTGEPVKMD